MLLCFHGKREMGDRVIMLSFPQNGLFFHGPYGRVGSRLGLQAEALVYLIVVSALAPGGIQGIAGVNLKARQIRGHRKGDAVFRAGGFGHGAHAASVRPVVMIDAPVTADLVKILLPEGAQGHRLPQIHGGSLHRSSGAVRHIVGILAGIGGSADLQDLAVHRAAAGQIEVAVIGQAAEGILVCVRVVGEGQGAVFQPVRYRDRLWFRDSRSPRRGWSGSVPGRPEGRLPASVSGRSQWGPECR